MLGALIALVWGANALEITLLRPTGCTLGRLQFDGWLLLARAVASQFLDPASVENSSATEIVLRP